MSLPKSFWERLPYRTDAELIEALSHPSDYEPEAIQAIRAEWEKRDLPIDRIASLSAASIARSDNAEAEALAKAQEPLGLWMAIKCGLFGFTLLPIFVYGYYRAHGYHRKASDAAKAMVLGFITFGVATIVRSCRD